MLYCVGLIGLRFWYTIGDYGRWIGSIACELVGSGYLW